MLGTQRMVGTPRIAQGYRCEEYDMETANARVNICTKMGGRKSGAQEIHPEYGNLGREALRSMCVKKNDTLYQWGRRV